MIKRYSFMVALSSLLMVHDAIGLPEANSIEFSNCMLSLPGTPYTAPARCGFLRVPENPDDPDGRHIDIHVAVASATSTETAADPVFFFAGGPGQAASETWVMMRGTLDKIRKQRDIVMIDQRGTGQSNKLQCTVPEDLDPWQDFDMDAVVGLTQECLETLDGDPRFYTTTIAMRDYDLVRQAMGYQRINLMGVSYGTRAAQVYLRNYPEAVRSVTLDSVLPMQLALGQEHAAMLDRAVALVFEDCRQEPLCSERFGEGLDGIYPLFEALREAPRPTSMVNPVTGVREDIKVDADMLAAALRFLSYSSETQAMLPLLVHEAVTTGRLERIAAQALLVMQGLNEMLAKGMELSVLCSEDYPYFSHDPNDSTTLMGDLFWRIIQAQCEVWPKGEVPSGFHDPVRSDTPVLLISGERDPVTPPMYADRVAETFENSLNLVARGQSHSLMKHACLKKITTEFIAQGSAHGLDIACVERIGPSPFFTSLLGPNP